MVHTCQWMWLQVPKLIHPLPPNEPRTPRSDAEDIEEEPPTPHPLTDTWMQVRTALGGSHVQRRTQTASGAAAASCG